MTGDHTGKFSGIADVKPHGTRVSQCPLCHEWFSGETTFAWHRIDREKCPTGSPGELWLGECRNPASKGMTLGRSGVWAQMTQHSGVAGTAGANTSMGTTPVKPEMAGFLCSTLTTGFAVAVPMGNVSGWLAARSPAACGQPLCVRRGMRTVRRNLFAIPRCTPCGATSPLTPSPPLPAMTNRRSNR